MTNVVKFQHLIRSLKGEAAEVLGHWAITNDNYPLAWERLNQVYNRTHQAGSELLQRLYQLPALMKGTRKDLQHLSNVANDVKRQITALGYDTNTWDLTFITVLEQKLDHRTKIAWELQRNQEAPTLQQLLEFIETRARALAYVSNDSSKPKENRKRFGDKTEHFHDTKKFFKPENKNEYKSNAPTNCLIPECKSTHFLYRCPLYLAKTRDDREKFVKRNKLCINCLSSGHFLKFCSRGNCTRCNAKHNSTLCFKNPFLKKTNQVRAVEQKDLKNN